MSEKFRVQYSGRGRNAGLNAQVLYEYLRNHTGKDIQIIITDHEKIEQLQAENTKLQAKLDLAVENLNEVKNWAEVNLDPSNGYFECRGDEDCDHCHGLGILSEIDEALAKIKEMDK